MYLSKSITLPNGATATYWVIHDFRHVNGHTVTTGILEGYINADVYAAEPNAPLERRNYSITMADSDFDSGSVYTFIYTGIKSAFDDLSDATLVTP